MKQPQTIFNTILVCMLALILFGTGMPSHPVQAATSTPVPHTQSSCDPSRTVQVSGTAVINIRPDRALIKLGVQSNGRSAKDAQAANSSAIKKVVKALTALGIESKDIATDWYTIEPVYEEYSSLRINGYRIYNIIEVTVRDVDKANEAIVAAFGAGANQVVDVQFYTSELRKYRDQARDMAMKAAAEKADALAQAAGADTGCVLSINENTYSYFNGWWWGYGNNQNQWTQNAVQNVAPSGEMPSTEDGPVSAGQISIRAEVSATFSLE